MSGTVVLASASRFRAALLDRAGVAFETVPSRIDERAVEQAVGDSGVTPEELAVILAEAKAVDVGSRFADRLVIGSDQTLSLDGEALHKVADMEEARRRLLTLSGRTHSLHSAVVLARAGEVVWRHNSTARMTMRRLQPAFIGRHLARVGSGVLSSVGAYQIEGEGIQLFERIEGDFFTIIGLPMLPLLDALRRFGAIDG
jgi:septum formation protein